MSAASACSRTPRKRPGSRRSATARARRASRGRGSFFRIGTGGSPREDKQMGFSGGKSGAPQARQHPAISGLQIQTSAIGKAIPLIYGATRIAGNLIWYGDFKATAHASSPPGGGKGGVAGGGGKGGSGGSTTYTYQT